MAKTKTYIVEKDGEFLVQPAITSADLGDTWKIFNTTSEDLVYRFADGTSPFTGGSQLDDLKVGGKLTRTIQTTGVAGSYTYEIFVRKSGKKAKGNSDPSIIIDN